MATGDRVVSSWQHQHEIIEAAQERGWEVTRYDSRAGVTLESRGIVLNITGHLLSGTFIRTLPEAHHLLVGEEIEVRYGRADPNRA